MCILVHSFVSLSFAVGDSDSKHLKLANKEVQSNLNHRFFNLNRIKPSRNGNHKTGNFLHRSLVIDVDRDLLHDSDKVLILFRRGSNQICVKKSNSRVVSKQRIKAKGENFATLLQSPGDSTDHCLEKFPDFSRRSPQFQVCVEESMTEIFSETGVRQLTQMFVAILFFHTSEYILAVVIHGASKVTLSSLLITKHYVLAMLVSVLEYMFEISLFPGLKQHWWISNFGLIMIVFGEIIRKTAIITAGKSFTHLIKIRHEDHHRLVTEGVYRIMRHPSYLGFLVWSVGTQVMLCNPVSVIAFAVVVWRFFAQRIPYEEHYLKQFFGTQYVEYAQRVPSGVPFVK